MSTTMYVFDFSTVFICSHAKLLKSKTTHPALVDSRLWTVQKSTFALSRSHFCTFALWEFRLTCDRKSVTSLSCEFSCDADRLRPEAALELRPACVPSDHRRSARGALSRRRLPAPILDAVLPAALNPQPQLLSAPARTGHLKRRKMANVCDIRELRALPRLRPQQGSGTRGQGGVSSHV